MYHWPTVQPDPGALWPQLKADWIQEGYLKLDL